MRVFTMPLPGTDQATIACIVLHALQERGAQNLRLTRAVVPFMTVLSQCAGGKNLLSQSAATSLDSFAAVALQHCLAMSQPLDPARTYEALQRLCPEDGWQLGAQQATLPDTQPTPQMVGPLPSQQAATAAVLLHDLLERHGGEVAAADCMLRFALASTATLARVMKVQSTDTKVCKETATLVPLLS